jgi:hypothetical protein
MADVNKGKVTELQGPMPWQSAEMHNVRATTGNIVTPLLPCALPIVIGDNIAYTIFNDGTGVVLARCD